MEIYDRLSQMDLSADDRPLSERLKELEPILYGTPQQNLPPEPDEPLPWWSISTSSRWAGLSDKEKTAMRDYHWRDVVLPELQRRLPDITESEINDAAYRHLIETNNDLRPSKVKFTPVNVPGETPEASKDEGDMGDVWGRGTKTAIDYTVAGALRTQGMVEKLYGSGKFAQVMQKSSPMGLGLYALRSLFDEYQPTDDPWTNAAQGVEAVTKHLINPQEATGKYAEPVDSFKDLADPGRFYQLVGENAPLMVGLMASALASPEITTVIVFGGEAGGVAKDIEDYVAATGTKVDPRKAAAVTLAVGGLNAALEMVSLERGLSVLKLKGMKERVARATTSFFIEVGTEGLQGGNQLLAHKVYDEMKRVGMGEYFTEVWQNILAAVPVSAVMGGAEVALGGDHSQDPASFKRFKAEPQEQAATPPQPTTGPVNASRAEPSPSPAPTIHPSGEPTVKTYLEAGADKGSEAAKAALIEQTANAFTTPAQMVQMSSLANSMGWKPEALRGLAITLTGKNSAAALTSEEADVLIKSLTDFKSKTKGANEAFPQLAVLDALEAKLINGKTNAKGKTTAQYTAQLEKLSGIRSKILNGDPVTDADLDELKDATGLIESFGQEAKDLIEASRKKGQRADLDALGITVEQQIFKGASKNKKLQYQVRALPAEYEQAARIAGGKKSQSGAWTFQSDPRDVLASEVGRIKAEIEAKVAGKKEKGKGKAPAAPGETTSVNSPQTEQPGAEELPIDLSGEIVAPDDAVETSFSWDRTLADQVATVNAAMSQVLGLHEEVAPQIADLEKRMKATKNTADKNQLRDQKIELSRKAVYHSAYYNQSFVKSYLAFADEATKYAVEQGLPEDQVEHFGEELALSVQGDEPYYREQNWNLTLKQIVDDLISDIKEEADADAAESGQAGTPVLLDEVKTAFREAEAKAVVQSTEDTNNGNQESGRLPGDIENGEGNRGAVQNEAGSGSSATSDIRPVEQKAGEAGSQETVQVQTALDADGLKQALQTGSSVVVANGVTISLEESAVFGWQVRIKKPSEKGAGVLLGDRKGVSGWTREKAITAANDYAYSNGLLARVNPVGDRLKSVVPTEGRLVSEAAADEARKILKEAFGRLNVGLDPNVVRAGVTLTLYHIENTARDWAGYTKAMLGDLREVAEKIRPYLRQWYEMARYEPGFDATGMTPSAELDRIAQEIEANNELDRQQRLADSVEVGSDDGGTGESETSGTGLGSESAGNLPAVVPGVDETAGDGGDTLPNAAEQNGERPGGIRQGRKRRNESAPGGTDELGGIHSERAGRSVRRRDGDTRVDYRIADVDRVGLDSGKKLQYQNNVAAIRLLKQIESEGRMATPDEQAVLVQYVGWGGLVEAFGNYASYRTGNNWDSYWEAKKQWQSEYTELRDLLTDEEYESARASTPNAHYTSVAVIRGIWDGLRKLGVKPGRIVDPSMGVGHFFGAAPDEIISDSQLAGVELDSISGRIAKQLYQTANVYVGGFESAEIPNNFVDLFISNVPFGSYTVYDPENRKAKHLIHDFFFLKALRKTRPGGLVAFITSAGTLDKQSSAVRREMAKLGDFVGAVRLPNDAFGKIAHTQVVTDVVIFQRRPEGIAYRGEPFYSTRPMKIDGFEYDVSEYYHNHPDRVLGTWSSEGSMYGANEKTVKSSDLNLETEIGRVLGELTLPQAFDQIQTDTGDKSLLAAKQIERLGTGVKAPEGSKDGGLYVGEGGELLQRKGEYLYKTETPEKLKPRIVALSQLRDALKSLIELQTSPTSEDNAVETARAELVMKYDGFAKEFGPVNSRENRKAFEADPDYALVSSLEYFDGKATTPKRSKILSQRTQWPPITYSRVGTGNEALLASLNAKGRVDMTFMETITGKTPDTIAEELGDRIFSNPEGTWETKEVYLSGNVRRKLAAAIAAAKMDKSFERNVEALTAVQPEDIPPGEISVRIGTGWVPVEDYNDFIRMLVGEGADRNFRVDVKFLESEGVWSIKTDQAPNAARNQVDYGNDRIGAIELIQLAMNGRTPLIYDYFREEGRDRKAINKDKTADATEKQNKIQRRFEEWLWENDGTKRADRLVRLYNDMFNNLVNPTFNGNHLTLPGSNAEIRLRKYQKDAIWRIMSNGNTLLAHVVGAGKTYTMVGAAMEMRRLNITKKAIFNVPNNVLTQWENSFRNLFPGSNILTVGKDDLNPQRRMKTIARIATGDWDAVIVPHSAFERIPLSEKRVRAFYDQQIAELKAMLVEAQDAAGKQKGKKKDPQVKQIEAAVKRLEVLLDRLTARYKKDKGPYFEELGIDSLFVDEAHKFKNLFFRTQMTRVPGVSSNIVQRAFDMFLKTQYINEITGYRGVVFATGTPISNSVAEMFTIQRYLQPQQLEERGIKAFDTWAHTFGEVISAVEYSPDGKFRSKDRFARFRNIPELTAIYRQVADPISNADAKIQIPKVRTGKPEIQETFPSSDLQAFVQDLMHRAEDIRSGRVDPRDDNMLKLTTDARKASLDMRLVDPSLPDNLDSKVNQLVANVHSIWAETTDQSGVQAIWCDLSTPGKGGFSIYDDIKSKLIGLGIPSSEIAFIHDADNASDVASAQQAIYERLNKGDLRIVIASTEKMGVGANLQQRLIAAHHLDAPYKPAELEQRDGRILRFGNMFDEVRIFRYVTKDSFDAFLWQMLERKATFIRQVTSGQATSRNAEDVDDILLNYSVVKAHALGDPRILDMVNLESEVGRLESLYSAWRNQNWNIRYALQYDPERIAEYRTRAEQQRDDYATYKTAREGWDARELPGVEFYGVTYEKPAEAAEGLRKAASEVIRRSTLAEITERMKAGEKATVREVKGKVFGFWVVIKEGAYNKPTAYIHVNHHIYDVELDADTAGNLQRIRNRLDALITTSESNEGEAVKLEQKLRELSDRLDKPFEHMEDFATAKEKLDKLRVELGISSTGADQPVIMGRSEDANGDFLDAEDESEAVDFVNPTLEADKAVDAGVQIAERHIEDREKGRGKREKGNLRERLAAAPGETTTKISEGADLRIEEEVTEPGRGGNDENVVYLNMGIPPAQIWGAISGVKEDLDKIYNDNEDHFDQVADWFGRRPRRALEKIPAGVEASSVIAEVVQEIKSIGGLPIKWMEEAGNRLKASEWGWMRENFKAYYETYGVDGVGWPSPALGNYAREYDRMKKYAAQMAIEAGVTVRVKQRIQDLLNESKETLARLEVARSFGEQGLGNKIGGLKNRIRRLQKRIEEGEYRSDESKYEPFAKHQAEHHFTHYPSRTARNAIIRQAGPVWEAIQKVMIENHIDLDMITSWANPNLAPMDRKFASMEEQRLADLPEAVVLADGTVVKLLETDPFVEANWYIHSMATRVATISVIRKLPGYGADKYPDYRTAINAWIRDSRDEILKQGGGANLASLFEAVWNEVTGRTPGIPAIVSTNLFAQAAVAAEAIGRSAMLSMSQVTQLGGVVPIFVEGEMKNTARAFLNIGKAKMGDKDAERLLEDVREMQGWSRDTLTYIEESSTLTLNTGEFSKKTLRALGFAFANRVLNKGASLAAIRLAEDYVTDLRAGGKVAAFATAKLKRYYSFRQADIDRMLLTGSSPKDTARIVQTMVSRVNVTGENPLDVPPWMRGHWSRRVLAFTSYSRAMGNLASDALWEAKQGHVQKLAVFLFGQAAAGLMVDMLKNFIFDRERKDEFWIGLMVSMLGAGVAGLWGSLALDLVWVFRIGGKNADPAGALAPPVMTFWWKFLRDLAIFTYEHDRDAFHKLMKTIPVFHALEVNVTRLIEGDLDTGLNNTRRRTSFSPVHRRSTRTSKGVVDEYGQ